VSEVLIIVAVVAVLAVIAAVVLLRRRRAARAGGVGEPGAVEPPAAGPAVREEAGDEEAAPTRATEEAASRAAEAEAVAAEAAAKPVLSEGELRSRVESQLTDSERMLGELREAATGGGEPALGAGSLEIMAEGLEEVRALARRKQWNQARDKCGALHAQLSLLLRSTRRERAS
jgi:hypothetical protein